MIKVGASYSEITPPPPPQENVIICEGLWSNNLQNKNLDQNKGDGDKSKGDIFWNPIPTREKKREKVCRSRQVKLEGIGSNNPENKRGKNKIKE